MAMPGQLKLGSGPAGLTDSKAADILALSWCLPSAPQLLQGNCLQEEWGWGDFSVCPWDMWPFCALVAPSVLLACQGEFWEL